jgi:hypothetical protein
MYAHLMTMVVAAAMVVIGTARSGGPEGAIPVSEAVATGSAQDYCGQIKQVRLQEIPTLCSGYSVEPTTPTPGDGGAFNVTVQVFAPDGSALSGKCRLTTAGSGKSAMSVSTKNSSAPRQVVEVYLQGGSGTTSNLRMRLTQGTEYCANGFH